MTDTTDIKALREQWETLNSRLDLDIFITTVLTALEAERQRADDEAALNKHLDLAVRQNEWINNNLRRRAVRAEAELAALKGDQVPVA